MERTEHEKNLKKTQNVADEMREDSAIERDIMKHFDDLGIGESERPAVIVENGSVILSGEVRHREDIVQCQQAVESVEGVRQVTNALRVVRGH